jgi:hypothetical protein
MRLRNQFQIVRIFRALQLITRIQVLRDLVAAIGEVMSVACCRTDPLSHRALSYRTKLLWPRPRSTGTSNGSRAKGLSPPSSASYCDTVRCHHLTSYEVMGLHLTNALWHQMVELINLGWRLLRNKRFTSDVKRSVNLLELTY